MTKLPAPLPVAERLVASGRLHARVVEYARCNISSKARDDEAFLQLAFNIAEFQASNTEALRALWTQFPPRSKHLAELPLLPVEALRLRDVFTFEPDEAECCFLTSGTTSGESGRHYLRTTATYRELALLAGQAALAPKDGGVVAVALMPFTGLHTESSLEFMVQRFMEAWDGHSLDARRSSDFDLAHADRWLLSNSGVNVEGLRRSATLARSSGQPLFLFTTSFALLTLLDALGSEVLSLPPGSLVMPTGGFKGRTREIDPVELRSLIEHKLGPEAVVHEYGMTELSSQLYEQSGEEPGLYFESSTVRVIPVHPVSLEPVADGEEGLASFVDLGNVDSFVRVLTQDVVRREAGGIRLLGRSKRASQRGCSLRAEALTIVESARPPSALGVLAPGVSRPSLLAGSTSAEPVLRGAQSSTVVSGVDRFGEASPAELTSRDRHAVRARLLPLLLAAGLLKDADSEPGQALRRKLLQSTGLSPEGIEVALSRCLETDVTEAQLSTLLGRVMPAPAAWVVLSANVFVAPLRAVLLALCASERVFVRPSRRDSGLSAALSQLAPQLFELVEEVRPEPSEHVYAYGSDTAMKAILERLPKGVVYHPHGDGVGVAFIADEESASNSAAALAEQVALFDQRGCLSPRIVVLTPQVRADRWLELYTTCALDTERRMPKGEPSLDELEDEARFLRTAPVVASSLSRAGSGWVATQEATSRGVLLAPPGRNLVVVIGRGALENVARASGLVTTVGVAGQASHFKRARELFPKARIVPIAAMQTPPLDGPVDLRADPEGRRL